MEYWLSVEKWKWMRLKILDIAKSTLLIISSSIITYATWHLSLNIYIRSQWKQKFISEWNALKLNYLVNEILKHNENVILLPFQFNRYLRVFLEILKKCNLISKTILLIYLLKYSKKSKVNFLCVCVGTVLLTIDKVRVFDTFTGSN